MCVLAGSHCHTNLVSSQLVNSCQHAAVSRKTTLFFWDKKKERWTDPLLFLFCRFKICFLKNEPAFSCFSLCLKASLSSLLITPFPSPGSSLTGSCASSYQRRWLRSQTTSLENGVFPRWWDLGTSAWKQAKYLSTAYMEKCSNLVWKLLLGIFFSRRVQECLFSWLCLF